MRTRIPLTSCSEPLLFVIRQNLLHNPFYTVLLAKAAAFFASFPLCAKSGNGLPLPKK